MLNKRPDGFHEIASLYQAISLGDFLTITPSDEADSLTCNDPSIPTNNSNLILRAAALFRRKMGMDVHFSFDLEKNIPIEAGLGGGSSNAATTLWGLNQFLGTKISDQTLAEWGAELGSDIPFFLSQGRAYCRGKGEILHPEDRVDSKALWIAKPKGGLPTPAVYQNVTLAALTSRDPESALHSHRTSAPIFFNDLENAAFKLAPQLTKTKQALLELGFEQVHMTGSGTAFFCLGSVDQPNLPQIDFFPAEFLFRDADSWYVPLGPNSKFVGRF